MANVSIVSNGRARRGSSGVRFVRNAAAGQRRRITDLPRLVLGPGGGEGLIQPLLQGIGGRAFHQGLLVVVDQVGDQFRMRGPIGDAERADVEVGLGQLGLGFVDEVETVGRPDDMKVRGGQVQRAPVTTPVKKEKSRGMCRFLDPRRAAAAAARRTSTLTIRPQTGTTITAANGPRQDGFYRLGKRGEHSTWPQSHRGGSIVSTIPAWTRPGVKSW